MSGRRKAGSQMCRPRLPVEACLASPRRTRAKYSFGSGGASCLSEDVGWSLSFSFLLGRLRRDESHRPVPSPVLPDNASADCYAARLTERQRHESPLPTRSIPKPGLDPAVQAQDDVASKGGSSIWPDETVVGIVHQRICAAAASDYRWERRSYRAGDPVIIRLPGVPAVGGRSTSSAQIVLTEEDLASAREIGFPPLALQPNQRCVQGRQAHLGRPSGRIGAAI